MPTKLARTRAEGPHTALDTCWTLGDRTGDALWTTTGLVLLDIKSGDPATYRRVTGGQLAPTLRFAHRLADPGVPMRIRFVLVPGLTDTASNVDAVGRHAAALSTVERVGCCRSTGSAKYAALGLRFPLTATPPPDAALLERVRRQLRDRGRTGY